MVDYKLEQLTTQHPGGWKDIIDYVNSNYDRYQASYKEIEAEVIKTPHHHSDGTLTYDVAHSGKDIEKALPRLEEIHHRISGLCASMGWAVLKGLQLPIPGHKDWIKPCSKWSKS